MDKLTDKTVVRRLATSGQPENALPQVLAVRAVELLRASLLELVVEQNNARHASPTKRRASEWAARPLVREPMVWGVETGAALLWHPGQVEPAFLSLARGRFALSVCACSPEPLQAIELRPDSLRDELLAHWAFDDASGTSVRDDSGNGRNGTLTANYRWLTDGQFGGALHLGEGDGVSVPRFPDATSGFTVSAWVRLAEGSQANVTDKWTTIVSTENSGGWELNVDHSQSPTLGLHFGFWKGPNQGDYEGHTCAGVTYGVWSQIAGVVDTGTSTYRVYRDGNLCFSTATEHKILPGSATLTIGEWPYMGRYLIGDVDDIALWGRALEPAEIELLRAQPVPKTR